MLRRLCHLISILLFVSVAGIAVAQESQTSSSQTEGASSSAGQTTTEEPESDEPEAEGVEGTSEQHEEAAEEEEAALTEALSAEEIEALEAAKNGEEETKTEAEVEAEEKAAEEAAESGAVIEDLNALNWNGAWHSYWRGGQAMITFSQEGTHITGTFQPGDGKITGTIEGVLVQGLWTQPGAEGDFEFAMSPDGSSFVGRFANGEYWNGERVTDGGLTTALFGRKTPKAVFSSYVSAENAAAGGDALAAILVRRYITFAEDPDADGARGQNARLAKLNEMVNASTFRLNLVADEGEDGKAETTLAVAGTAFSFTLNLIEVLPEEWAVEIPTLSQIETIEKGILEATESTSLEDLAADRLRNPRQSLKDFLIGSDNWYNGGANKVLATLDMSDIPSTLQETDGPISAEYIRQILNRLGQFAWQEVPDDPDRRQPLMIYKNAGGELVLDKVIQEDDSVRWMFTAQSLADAPQVYQVMQNLPLAPGVKVAEPLTDAFRLRTEIRKYSPNLLKREFILENWQWVAIAAALLIGFVGSYLISLVFRIVTRALLAATGSRTTSEDPYDIAENKELREKVRRDYIRPFRWPMVLFLAGAFLLVALRRLGLRQDISEITNIIDGTMMIVGGTFFFYSLVSALTSSLSRAMQETESQVDDVAAILGGGVAKISVLVGGVLMLADLYDLPYEGVIAALGVGGLAFGFAAKDAVANLIGAGVLMADRPFKKGDFIEVGGVSGTVEDVGMRSTRLRTIDDAVVILPNGQISEGTVNNMGQRRRRRVAMTLGMTYETPRAKLEEFTKRLILMMDADTDILPDPRVALANFGAYSIDIELLVFLKSPDIQTYIRNRHELIGSIIDLANEIGVDFAFPSQTVYMANAEEPTPGAAPLMPA